MALVGPEPISFNPVQRLTSDLRAERRTEVPFPPGDTSFSLRRTRALDGWRDGGRIDLYYATRRLALRIAMRALFGLDPDAAGARTDVARNFEQGLGFWSRDYFLQVLRGPRTPFAQMQEARRALDAVIFTEISRRRRTGERGKDVLSLLIDASDEDGNQLGDRQIRDEVMTLLF